MAWVPNSAARIAGAHIPPRIVPTRASQAVFRAKALVHQIARGIRNRGAGLRRFQKFDGSGLSFVVAQSRTALWSDERLAERAHQLGKVQNLRRAAAALDGILVPAGEVFSFWKQVGRASRRRGFVVGRMLQQGCVVPAVGGGLCQLSNALYETALQAGCEIVERHPHSRVVAGSSAANGRDATVAWNYVDLRFRPRHGLRIAARVTRDDLVIEFHGHPDTAAGVAPALPGAVEHRQTANSCTTCGEIACFRHERARPGSGVAAPAAYLVDENWPEFREFIGARRQPRDVLGLPLDGGRWRLPRYRWDTSGFVRVETATFRAFRRALAMRRLPAQGAIRRQAELQAAEAIARRLSRLLMPEIETVWIAQSLLPFLWRDGNLGGREVRVLMTRLPMHVLQARLDHFWGAPRSSHSWRFPRAAVDRGRRSRSTRLCQPDRDAARRDRSAVSGSGFQAQLAAAACPAQHRSRSAAPHRIPWADDRAQGRL